MLQTQHTREYRWNSMRPTTARLRGVVPYTSELVNKMVLLNAVIYRSSNGRACAWTTASSWFNPAK